MKRQIVGTRGHFDDLLIQVAVQWHGVALLISMDDIHGGESLYVATM
jgi:hypothetical protein